MKIQPLDERLLIIVDEADGTTASGIIIPDTAKKIPRRGTIASVGTDKDMQRDFKEGERVAFHKHAGNEVTYDGQDYTIIGRTDVLVKIKE